VSAAQDTGKRRAPRCPACLRGEPCPLPEACPPGRGGPWEWSRARGPQGALGAAAEPAQPAGPPEPAAPDNDVQPARLVVQTARIGYAGADGFNVTRDSGDADGVLFAPSWSILRPALAARMRAISCGRDYAHDAQVILDAAWAAYVPAYLAEMRASYRTHRAVWDRVLARPRVVLVCYCVEAERCHRTVLAGILGKLGADVRGETW